MHMLRRWIWRCRVLLASATESKNQMQSGAALEVVLRGRLVVAPIIIASVSLLLQSL